MTSIGLLGLIPSWMLISVGLILIGVEIFIGLYILLWFGLGLVFVGLMSFFVDFGHGEIQLIFAFAIGTVLLFALRQKLIAPQNAQTESLSTYEAGETGVLSQHNGQWMVFYHGTHWLVANPNDDLTPGQKIKVTQIKSNQAWIETES
ncbi:NfeD family protein [Thiomicrospira sp.]|uniref:NfeD family protein n=1 Tax=Thiomicrospira sp. TaxID=935 RepID=UPI002F94D20F